MPLTKCPFNRQATPSDEKRNKLPENGEAKGHGCLYLSITAKTSKTGRIMACSHSAADAWTGGAIEPTNHQTPPPTLLCRRTMYPHCSRASPSHYRLSQPNRPSSTQSTCLPTVSVARSDSRCLLCVYKRRTLGQCHSEGLS